MLENITDRFQFIVDALNYKWRSEDTVFQDRISGQKDAIEELVRKLGSQSLAREGLRQQIDELSGASKIEQLEKKVKKLYLV